MVDAAYRLSFTTGGLLRAEAVAMAPILLSSADQASARARAIDLNVVQQRTTASIARLTTEVVQRLAGLPRSGVELIANGSTDQTRHLMWLAACVRYRFLRDFGREVIRERHVAGRPSPTVEEFEAFWNVQSSWIDALRDVTDSTRRKLRQNTFRMLDEAEFVDGPQILPAMPSPAVLSVIRTSAPELLLSFPVDDAVAATSAAGNEEP